MWKICTFLLAVITLDGSACNAEVQLDHKVLISNGHVAGNPRDGAGILSFKGIPYARPPVGNLRWRSPQPALSWSNVLNATNFGFTCWQSVPFYPIYTPQNEDCLTVNVWTPAKTAKDALPVMVWFHGGGFVFGGGDEKAVHGTNLAKEGVVVVTFNYRLNTFGFLAHPELDKEGSNSGNFGLQDQLAALAWVKSNIAAFGGNPAHVTAFGESAGAHAIGLLMSSPLAKGLFEKAIIESGSMWDSEHGSLMPFDLARQNGTAFGVKLNATTATELRALPAQIIHDNSICVFQNDPTIACFTPSIDKHVVPEPPATLASLKQQMKIPILAGWNALEGSVFLTRAIPHKAAAQFRSGASAYFGSRTSEFLKLYPANTNDQAKDSALALIGDLVISQQTWEIGDSLQKSGVSDVYMYMYNYSSPYSPLPNHGVEFPFVFGNLLKSLTGAEPSMADFALSAKFMKYWANFAKFSNPNGNGTSGLPTWPKYAADGTGIFGIGNTIGPINFDLGRYRFIQSLRVKGVLPAHWMKVEIAKL
jgi:para-nitrobenzyl esterase